MKFGFFFGAGAEVGYGLPLGGKFAIDLFRQDNTDEKALLRDVLNGIDKSSVYATKWLPDNYFNKRIHAFGKTEFRSLIESSIEYRRSIIIQRLNNIDSLLEKAIANCGINAQIVSDKYFQITQKVYGEHKYSQLIKVNATLASSVKIFESEFYSAVLDIIRSDENSSKIERYATSILQLLIGAYGQELVQKVNQEIFTEAPDDLTIFDDISGMFRLEFDKIGNTALDLLLHSNERCNIDANSSCVDIFYVLLKEILEILFIEVLDYQALIDSHWRYLYSPKENWAKFMKMVIFLQTTRSYMLQQLKNNFEASRQGYYDDLVLFSNEEYSITGVGTANYNNLIGKIASDYIPNDSIYHLNGSINDYYNAYKNTVRTFESTEIPKDQIYVPFMLTQSGVKPLTSISMSRRYIDLFDKLKASDALIAIGYNFNIDDNHINGLFRQLIEDEGKIFFWVVPTGGDSETKLKQTLEEKMRLPASVRGRVYIIKVDKDSRKTSDDKLWSEAIILKISEIQSLAEAA